MPVLGQTASPVPLGEKGFTNDLGVIILSVNWGRTWNCGSFENAQLQGMSFTRAPTDAPQPLVLQIDTPSKLFAKNRGIPYALVVAPGKYFLTGFDVKVARSVSEVMHILGSRNNLTHDGVLIGGSFSVKPGEIVYIGHFGLDCGAEPFFWRTYLDGRAEFERFVADFRERYPSVEKVPVEFRLFDTSLFGHPFVLDNPTVQ